MLMPMQALGRDHVRLHFSQRQTITTNGKAKAQGLIRAMAKGLLITATKVTLNRELRKEQLRELMPRRKRHKRRK